MMVRTSTKSFKDLSYFFHLRKYIFIEIFFFFRVQLNSNERLFRTDSERMRLKYYSTCRKMELKENHARRASVIQEEEGENTPLLNNNHSINNAAEGFLVRFFFS